MYRCLVEKELAGQRLDRFLARCLPKAPVSFFYKMLRRKNITLNGKRAQGGERLKEGDEIRFFLSRETLEKFSGGDLPGLVPVEGDTGKQHPGKRPLRGRAGDARADGKGRGDFLPGGEG